jgi:hypothetical protein
LALRAADVTAHRRWPRWGFQQAVQQGSLAIGHIPHISFYGGDLEQSVHPPSATVIWLFARQMSWLIAGGRCEV